MVFNRRFGSLAIAMLLCVHYIMHAQSMAVGRVRSLAKQFLQEEKDFTVSQMDAGCILVQPLDKEGYVLLSNDDSMPVVLAYDKNASFQRDSIPLNVKKWIDGYGQMSIANEFAPHALNSWLDASSLSVENVEPLLGETQWGQDSPYNYYCPMLNNKKCPTGCVATALAQVMRYHQWPRSGFGKIVYNTDTRYIPVSFDFSNTTFEWHNLIDSYQELPAETPVGVVLHKNNRFVARSIGLSSDYSKNRCKIEIPLLTIMGESGYCGKTAMVITNVDDGSVRLVSNEILIDSPRSGQLLKDMQLLISVPDSIPDGIYNLYNVVYDYNSLNWNVTTVINREKNATLKLKKDGKTFIFNDHEFACSPSLENINAVAKLMQAVGAAVKMDYDEDASGSNDCLVLTGMTTYLNYDIDMFFANPEEYNDKQWHQLLQTELIQGRPVYYTGHEKDGGHAFVIDGIQKNQESGLVYYHVNWGWDGLCNGYYLLNMLRPIDSGTGGTAGNNYSNSPTMLIGLKPEDGISTMSMTCKSLEISRDELFPGQTLSVVLSKLVLRSSSQYVGNIQLELHSLDKQTCDSVIVVYKEDPRRFTSSLSLTNYYMPCQIPLHTPSGHYELVLVSNGTEGDKMKITIGEWPRLYIKSQDDWVYGKDTQSLQLIAMGKGWHLSSLGSEGEVSLVVDSIVNPLSKDVKGRLSLLLCDGNGVIQSPLDGGVDISINGYAVKKNMSISGILSKNMPDGNYYLRLGFLPNGETLWTFCDMMEYDGNIYWSDYSAFAIALCVENGFFSVNNQMSFEGADIPWLMGVGKVMINDFPIISLYDIYGRKLNRSYKGVYLEKTEKNIVKRIK